MWLAYLAESAGGENKPSTAKINMWLVAGDNFPLRKKTVNRTKKIEAWPHIFQDTI